MKNKTIIVILSIVITILLLLLILLGVGVISFKYNENTPDTKAEQKVTVSKEEILKYYKSIMSDNADEHHKCSIIDINDDNIPELFIYTTGVIGNEIVAITNTFTYDENVGTKDNDYIVRSGILSGRIDDNTVFYKMNDGSLLSVFGHMGYEIVSSYKLENDWFNRTSISYKYVDKYMTGDNIIEFKSCSDESLIK